MDDEKQIPLFKGTHPSPLGDTAPYQPHSETSREAAERIEPAVGTERRRVLMALRFGGKMTDEEMQITLGMNPSTQRPRRIELVKAGFVRDSGETGLTSTGRKATLWEAIP